MQIAFKLSKRTSRLEPSSAMHAGTKNAHGVRSPLCGSPGCWHRQTKAARRRQRPLSSRKLSTVIFSPSDVLAIDAAAGKTLWRCHLKNAFSDFSLYVFRFHSRGQFDRAGERAEAALYKMIASWLRLTGASCLSDMHNRSFDQNQRDSCLTN